MASGRDQDIEVGFEEGTSRLSSLVLDEAVWDTKEYAKQKQRPEYHNLPKLPLVMQTPLASNSVPRNCRRKCSTNWASGEPGMQAFFLDSGKKPCGTGVFLPQRRGTDLQYNKKPGCSPVLLPARVVQALNLNVNELRLHISRRQDARNKSNSKGEYCNSVKHKHAKDVATQFCVVPQKENSSPEIFLPKEWTY